jgi:von Willebrand factor type A domain
MRASVLSRFGSMCALLAAIVGCAGARVTGVDAGQSNSGGPSGSGGATNVVTSGSGGSISGGSSSGSGGSKTPTADANCGQRMFDLKKVPPDVLIVLDRSGSMGDAVPMGTCAAPPCSKWTEVSNAVKKVVTATDTAIRWGIKFFPEDTVHCQVGPGVAVPIGDMTGAAIGTAIDAQLPQGAGTPTQVAMMTATTFVAGLQEPNAKYILLATDGEPNCNPGPGGNAAAGAGTVAAVAAAAAMGIPVFVVGIATSGPADAVLSMVAIAGKRPRAGMPPYYPVANGDDLVAALGTIGGQIASCTFGFGEMPPDPDNIEVTAGGVKIPKDPAHASGWDYGTGQMSIVLYGSYCDKAKDKTLPEIQAIFGCPGLIIK